MAITSNVKAAYTLGVFAVVLAIDDHIISNVASQLSKKWVGLMVDSGSGGDVHHRLKLLSASWMYCSVHSAPWKLHWWPDFAHSFLAVRMEYAPDHYFEVVADAPRITWLYLGPEKHWNLTYIPFNCLFLVAKYLPQVECYSMTQVYKTSRGSQMLTHPAGGICRNGNASILPRLSQRRDFHGDEIIVKPFPVDTTTNAITKMPNFIPDMWEAIAKSLNVFFKPTNDTSLFDLDLDLVRLEEGTLSSIPVVIYIDVRLYYKEVTDDLDLNRFSKPFSPLIWALTVSFLVGTSVLMLAAVKFNNVHLRETLLPFLDALYIHLQQGSQITERVLSVSVTLGCQLLLSVFLYNAYSGVLVSFITVKIPRTPFTSLEDVLKDDSYKMLVTPKGGLHHLKVSKHNVMQELLKRKVVPLNELPLTFMEALSRVCHSQQRLVTECAPNTVAINMRDLGYPCVLSKSSVPFVVTKKSFVVRNELPLKEAIKLSVTKLLEGGGIGTKILWTKTVPLLDPEVDYSVTPVSLHDMLTAFTLLAAGCLVSCLICAFEHMRHVSRRRP